MADYTQALQNALINQPRQNAIDLYKVNRQRSLDQATQQQQQFNNAIARDKMQALKQEQDLKIQQYHQQILNDLPATAYRIKAAPPQMQGTLYNIAADAVKGVNPNAQIPQWGTPEASQLIDQYASQYQPKQNYMTSNGVIGSVQGNTFTPLSGQPSAGKQMPKNAFEAFTQAERAKGITDPAKINADYQEQQTKIQQGRYGHYTGVGIPGYAMDRYTGEMVKLKLPEGTTLGGVSAVKADTMALKDITKREQTIGSFVRRIDANLPIVERLAGKLGNQDIRLLNVPLNSLKGKVGSGVLQSLKLAMQSTSNEVAKVESGSIGIAEVSQGQADIMNKIYDADLSLNDLHQINNVMKELGHTSMKAIGGQRNDLIRRISTTSGERQTQPESMPIKNSKGWPLMHDADGNMAYVGPNGQIEEVK